MDLRNITREQFETTVCNLCRIYSERAETIGREQGWAAPACVELLALDLFIIGADSRPVQAVRAYLAAGCEAYFKGERTPEAEAAHLASL
jgi:hypothetical protein